MAINEPKNYEKIVILPMSCQHHRHTVKYDFESLQSQLLYEPNQGDQIGRIFAYW
jgi:hypothetical protein